MKYTYDYPMVSYAVDIIPIIKTDGKYRILLINRKRDPYANYWALPGGYVDPQEKGIQAAQRELFEETGCKVELLDLFSLGVYDDVYRHPGQRVISQAFCTFITDFDPVSHDEEEVTEYDKVLLSKIGNKINIGGRILAFDHQKMIEDMVDYMGLSL